MKYNLAIIGGGIGGLMTAYRYTELHPDHTVCIFERGNTLDNRACPIVKGQVKQCIKCKNCAIMEGMAGCGAFSDGKFIKSTEYGGWLADYIGEKSSMKHIQYVDDVLLKFGATEKLYHPSNKIKQECLKYDLHMQQGFVRHLGTDGNYQTMLNIIKYLEEKITIRVNANVTSVDFLNKYLIVNDEKEFEYDSLVIAVGRVGSGWFGETCYIHNIELVNNQVDIGVRVELPRVIWEDISKEIYEPKIVYRTKQYGDTTRMFCFNSGGEVVTENSDGILTVNGHANSLEENKRQNSNFAILSTINFTQPFNQPIEYAKHIAKLSNMISGGGVIVQRLGDLVNGIRSNQKRLLNSRTLPSLDAVAGDLSLCIPKRQLDNIIETLYALDKIAPETANYDTLLYGVEAKYYSVRPKFINNKFEIYKDVYAVGDGCGVTRSLSQAGAQGVYVAESM